MLVQKGLYKHYKGGIYLVLDQVKHTETQEELILYRRADKEQLWVRPAKMFRESVTVEGVSVPRFALIPLEKLISI